MTDDRDQLVAAVFADAAHELDGEAFVADVVARARFHRVRLLAPWGVLGFVLIVGGLFAVPFDMVQLVTRLLTTSLVDLGGGWLGWIVAPVNSVAALVVVTFKAVRTFRKRFVRRYA